MRLDLVPKLYDLGLRPAVQHELIITVAPGQTRFLLAQLTPNGGAELLELSQDKAASSPARASGVRRPEMTSTTHSIVSYHARPARLMIISA